MKDYKKISKENVEDILNLTPLQEGLLYHYLNEPESNQYFEQLSLNISGEINYEIFKNAWGEVSQTNEILRTIFRWNNISHPIQIILKKHNIPICYVDLSNYGESEKPRLLENLKEEDLNKKIDISEETFRITLVKLSEDLFEMIVSNHHIILDGWSNAIILQEFIDVYQRLVENKEIDIKKKRKFKDYVKWIQNKDKNEQAKYWTRYLEGFDIKTSLPINSSLKKGNREIKSSSFTFNPKLMDAIKEFAFSHHLTFASVLYSAWGILLQKYNNSSDVVFGTAVSGRNPELNGIEEMVGLFINTLPLRVNKKPNDTVIDLLNRINLNLRERTEFESTPLIDINSKYSELNTDGNLFDSIMVIENYPIDEAYLMNGKKLKINSYTILEETNFDLSLQVILFNSKVELVIQYDGNVTDINTISKLKSHLINILEEIINFPNKKISQINYLSAEEEQLLINNFMGKSTGISNEPVIKLSTLQDKLDETLNINNENIAIEYLNRKISYSNLERESNIIANRLILDNIQKGTFIGIYTNDRVSLITCMIGILKAGCVFVPLDPSYPIERVKAMLSASDTGIVITDKNNIDKIQNVDISCKDFDEIMSYQNIESLIARPKIKYDPEDMIYIFFTSGSTGTPKAVLGRNKSLLHFISWEIDEFKVSNDIRVSQFTSPCHNPLLRDIFVPLCAGGTICIPDSKEKMLDSRYLARWIDESKINLIHCTPSLFKIINENKLNIEMFVNLKYILLAGERTVPKDLVDWYELFGERIKLVSLYGQTETTLAKMFYYIKTEDAVKDNIPIGKPIYDTQIGIFDKDMNLCTTGFKGEIYVRTPYISLGYYNNLEFNKKKFIVNPFDNNKDDIIYKTGDLGRMLPDGNIEFLGREDRQIKIRGFRIELNEVENAILLHDEVKETALISRENEFGKPTLCAYVVLNKSDDDISQTDNSLLENIRHFLINKLPDFMVPQYIMPIDKLPVNLNGKLDYNALPEPKQKEYKAPITMTEQKIAEMWSDILGVKKIGRTDKFLESGGHSLNVMSLVFKIQQVFNIELPLSLIFNNVTVEELSKYIDEDQKETISSDINTVETRDFYPLSGTQKGMFILNQLEKNSTFYNIPYVTKIEGELDITQLEKSIILLIKRHETLRTSFHYNNGEPMQKVHEDINFKLEVIEDLNINIEEEVKEFTRPFSLEQPPLFRVKLIKIKGDLSYLLFDMHHIITDGVSMTILNRDLLKFYEDEELPQLNIQYKDYVEWQLKNKNSVENMNQRDYWLEIFNSRLERVEFRSDFPRSERMKYTGNVMKFNMDQSLSNQVYSLAKELECTPFIVLFAGYNVLLHKYSNQNDIVVGVPISGRTNVNVQDLVGPFINLLAIRNKIEPSETAKYFLSKVKENILNSFANQNYSFEDLVTELNLPNVANRHPIFDTMFVMQNMGGIEMNTKNTVFKEYELEKDTTKIDISFIIKEKDGIISIEIEYSVNLFKEQTIKQLGENFIEVLKGIVNSPYKEIKDINITNLIQYNVINELETESFSF